MRIGHNNFESKTMKLAWKLGPSFIWWKLWLKCNEHIFKYKYNTREKVHEKIISKILDISS